MKLPITHRADERPRFHVWPHGTGARFRYGVSGMIHDAPSIGAAVERAVAAIDGRDAVIIYEGQHA